MLWTLIKKEFRQLGFSLTSNNRKKDKKMGKGTIALFVFLFIYIAVVFGALFYNSAGTMAEALVPLGMGWLVFSMIGMVATILGLIGSVLTTYNTLYQAKDNELMLSMPIPSWMILFARMLSCYITTFAMEALAFIPTYFAYAEYAEITGGMIAVWVINILIHPIFALALACILSWLIAAGMKHLPANMKNAVTVVFTIAFLVVFYILYFKALNGVADIINKAENLSVAVQTYVFLFYHQGLGCVGKLGSYLIYAGISIGLFLIIYYLLSRSFIKLVTSNKGMKRVKYSEKKLEKSSIDKALFRRELKRFTGSAAYMMNGALGTIFMVAAGIALIIFKSDISELIAMVTDDPGELALLACVMIAFMLTMTVTTGAAISIEGKNLWISHTIPVDGWRMLRAKLYLQYVLAIPSAILMLIGAAYALNLDIWGILLNIVMIIGVEVYIATIGLRANLKMPNINWVNETAAVKNSFAMVLAIFGAWGYILVLAIIYIAVGSELGGFTYLSICALLTVILAAQSYLRLKKHGPAKYAEIM